MSSIKQALEKDIARIVPDEEKRQITRMLFEKMIEKRRRQDEKYRILVQGTFLVAMVVLLLYIFVKVPAIADYQTLLTGFILGLVLYFGHICQKALALISHGK